MKKSWGESVTQHLGTGVLGVLMAIPFLLAGLGLFVMGEHTLAWAVIIGGLMVTSVIMSALAGVWRAVLYNYAASQQTPDGFDVSLIESAYLAKA